MGNFIDSGMDSKELVETQMGKYPISFILIVLILGFFIGAVSGSLLGQIFGLEIFNRALLGQSLVIIEDFYVLQKVAIQLTPGAILGFIISAWLLYRGR